MLPSLGFQEILLLAILALVVIGPKDLPLLLRKMGRWTARLRAMAQEFRSGFDELARQAELDELKREVDALRRNQTLSDLRHEITRPAILPGTLPAPPGSPAGREEMPAASPPMVGETDAVAPSAASDAEAAAETAEKAKAQAQ
jgi:sec-independent protein translocase protein TatB